MTGLALILLLGFGPCGPPTALSEGGCLSLPTSAVVRVYDGDTLTVRVPGWPPLFRELSFRLRGYDTPEIRGRCDLERELAVLAREALTGTVQGGEWIRLGEVERGRYFRLVGTLTVDGTPVASRLIEAGLARSYDGGTRQPWCEVTP